ncbi:MAG: hypothetical protein JO138_09915 [Acidobacteriaceae bacterium]|nr:hypothetical protein [Acidobacteriaceae bacterium]
MIRAHWADYMSIRGRHDEAIMEYNKVLELDPILRVRLGHFRPHSVPCTKV